MKTVTIGFRLGAKEKQQYKKKLEKYGYSVSDFARLAFRQGVNTLCNGGDMNNINLPPHNVDNIVITIQTDDDLLKTDKNTIQINYTLTKEKKCITEAIATRKNDTPSSIIRKLLLAWYKAKLKNTDEKITEIKILPSKREGRDEKICFRISKALKEGLDNVLKEQNAKMTQLITALLDAWIAANKHELSAEETL